MADIQKWDVEDDAFWESTGKKIANRNLWISIPSLLCGFAVWLYWGIITVQMLNLGFPFAKSELFTLAAIAGLTGATLRIPITDDYLPNLNVQVDVVGSAPRTDDDGNPYPDVPNRPAYATGTLDLGDRFFPSETPTLTATATANSMRLATHGSQLCPTTIVTL